MNKATLIWEKHRKRLNLKKYLINMDKLWNWILNFNPYTAFMFLHKSIKTVKTRAEFICFSFMKVIDKLVK